HGGGMRARRPDGEGDEQSSGEQRACCVRSIRHQGAAPVTHVTAGASGAWQAEEARPRVPGGYERASNALLVAQRIRRPARTPTARCVERARQSGRIPSAAVPLSAVTVYVSTWAWPMSPTKARCTVVMPSVWIAAEPPAGRL